MKFKYGESIMINFDKWCNDLKKYWLQKDITSILELFDSQVEYYETPFQKIDNIKEVWEDIETQELTSLEYRIIGIKENTAIANFIMDDNGEVIDMIYEIKLNDLGKCDYFKQWYMCSN